MNEIYRDDAKIWANRQMMRAATKKEDGTTCKIWKIPCIELTEKLGDWV